MQLLLSLQTTALPGAHLPSAHASPLVQTVPSSQGRALLLLTQPLAGSQESLVHALLSLQFLSDPAAQLPPLHKSPIVQTLLSVHTAALLGKMHPLTGSHASLVQGLPSLQPSGLPGAQDPPLHKSLIVQTLLSSQGKTLGVYLQDVSGSQESVVHGLASSQTLGVPDAQAPLLHASSMVQALPSLQRTVLIAKTQPLALLQLSSVHKLPSLHCSKLPGAHRPSVHASPVVQALLSSQGRMFATFLQPATASQVSVVHGFLSSHTGGMPATQTPLLQTSPVVHALLSSHALELLLKPQPLALSHASSVQGLLSLQTTAFPLAHAPAAHASPVVHASPSSQALALNAWLQPPTGLQLSVVHEFLSSQSTPRPDKQPPFLQASPLVQALLSSQGKVLFVLLQPPLLAQVSSVQGFPSLQTAALPAAQAPPMQLSPTVHASPSEQTPLPLPCRQPPMGSQLSMVQTF